MKVIALIHTVKPLLNNFEKILEDTIDEKLKIHNIYDDFLASDPDECGEFTINNANRLLSDIKSAELTGADLIIVTCSTLTPIVAKVRPFIKVPIIAIDDLMTKEAVKLGSKILILATASSTEIPLRSKLQADANAISKKIEVSFLSNPDAYKEMKVLNVEKHDEIILDLSKNIKGYDCIVLAQASMAHLDEKIQRITNIPVLSNIPLCLKDIKDNLLNLQKRE